MNECTENEDGNLREARIVCPLFPEYFEALCSQSSNGVNPAPCRKRQRCHQVDYSGADNVPKLRPMNEEIDMDEVQPGIEKELDAIRTIASVLQPLDAETQRRVLDYVARRFKINLSERSQHLAGTPAREGPSVGYSTSPPGAVEPKLPVMDIRAFREQKQPKTDIQMAAVVAYYLAELAPQEERKVGITAEDLRVYFKQANHPLPKEPKFALWNGKAAGYFNSDGQGNYALNAVGHNLVAHNLPRSDSGNRSAPRTKQKVKPKTGRAAGKKKGK